jgi:hypothetical protein
LFGSGNPDNCGIDKADDGTAIKAVADPSFGQQTTETQCMKDNAITRFPAESSFLLSMIAPSSGGSYPVEVWAEGGNSGTRLTPIYKFDVVVSESGSGDDPNDDPADDPDDGGDDPAPPSIDNCTTRGIVGGIAVDVVVTAEDSGTLSLPVSVDGQQIIAPTRSYSSGSNSYTVEIPTAEMPVGEAMPVGIGIN